MGEAIYNFLFSVNFVALLGAVTGSISLGWKIYTHLQERSGNIKIIIDVDQSVRNTVHLTFTNIAFDDRRIIYVGYRNKKSGCVFSKISSLFKKPTYIEVNPTQINRQLLYRFQSQPKLKLNHVLSRGDQLEMAFILPSFTPDKHRRLIKVKCVDSLGKQYYSKWTIA